MLIFSFLLAPIAVFGQEEGRPLRTNPPQTIVPSSPPSQTALRQANSLITETALEQTLTQHYIAQYSSPNGIKNLNAILERASIYLPFIKDEVARRNMPEELAYLPIIESGFQITARSRSGAVGLWQFMMNSIAPFDIRVTDLIDERLDFIKSTRGALQKLDENYRALGSWELALAAYNSGLGAVNRIVRRTEGSDYWELSKRNQFRQETAHFVPKLIAASYVISQARRYGVDVWQRKLEWTAITLQRQISLDILANEAEIPADLLRRLNAELLHGISPIDPNYRLKVPSAQIERINEVLDREDLKLIRYHYHVVRYGDTLWSMSRSYGTPLNMIEQHNPGVANRHLRIGETIVIPAFSDAPPTPPPVTENTANFRGTHVVQGGETFWSLSRQYGVDPQSLAEANGMRLNDILHEGRAIRVPILE
ncbi:MAG: transglycosylase SLT domain-containing protein [Treponema sp.]|jgi:membrane-bound lytic murein transglycosylase D|nr:transglycosylase SLT domain-containing protein [Treponema sp.]